MLVELSHAPTDQPEAKGTSVVDEIITALSTGTGFTALALVAKYGFDALKVHLLTKRAKPDDIPKIANAAYRHADRRIVDLGSAGPTTCQDGVQHAGGGSPVSGAEPAVAPPNP